MRGPLVVMQLTVLSFAALLAMSACAPTDTGNPPSALDGSRVAGEVLTGFADAIVTFEGRAGAIEPADGAVYLVALDTPSIASESAVQSDGSFGGLSLSMLAQSFRVFARTSAGMSEAIDWRLDADGVTLVERGVDPCVRVLRALEVEADGTGSARIANDCAAQINVTLFMLGEGVEASAPGPIEFGSDALLTFSLSPPAGDFAIASVDLQVEGAVSGILRMSLLSPAP